MGTCANCRQQRGRLVDDRCNTCYRYRKRTGRDRDIDRIVATNGLRLERQQASSYTLQVEFRRKLNHANEAEILNDHEVYDVMQGLRLTRK